MAKTTAKKLGVVAQKLAKGGNGKKLRAPSKHADGVVADKNNKGKFTINRNAACWHMYGCPFCGSFNAASSNNAVSK